MNGDNSLHNSIYISLNLELRSFLTKLLQGNIIIQYTINLRKLNFFVQWDWLRLFLFENKVGNIAKTATWMHSTNLVRFYPTPAKFDSTCPNTDCLATSNGFCTKRNTTRFGLMLFENEVNNNSQTWPLIHLTSLATFYSKTLLLKWVIAVKEYYKYEMNMNKWLKNKIFKQGIGIAEKSQETRRDRWGGNVNHKCLFWLSDPWTL